MNPIAVSRCKSMLPQLLVLLLLVSASASSSGQQPQGKPNPSVQLTPISLPHLYWHFLMHQSVLDAAAARLDAQGKSGRALHNDLQNRLGFSDADFAPIRTSSQRLASELNSINAQLKALPRTAANVGQARALIAQRDAYIANEVHSLSQVLSPQNKAALEIFMTQFFAPKPLTLKVSPSTAQPAGNAVSQ